MGRPLPCAALWGDKETPRRLAADAKERLASETPESAPPISLVTLLAKKLGQHDGRAEPLLRAAQGRHPEDFWLNCALGDALRERKPAESVGFYRAALATRPTVGVVHYEVGTALRCQGQVDEAMAEFRRAVEFEPDGAPARFQLGTCLEAMGRLDEAMAEYRRVIELDPKGAPGHHQLGVCWQAMGRLDKAMAEYRRAIELDPKSSLPHYQLGVCWLARDRFDEAIAEFRRLIELEPKWGLGHDSLADALLRSGRFAEARTAVRRSLDVLPAEEPLADPAEEAGAVRADARPRRAPAGAPPEEGPLYRGRTTGRGPLLPGPWPAGGRRRPVRGGLRFPTGARG